MNVHVHLLFIFLSYILSFHFWVQSTLHRPHLLFCKIHIAIFKCMSWCKIILALIAQFVCQLVYRYNSNWKIGSMIFIVLINHTKSRRAWCIDFSFCLADQFTSSLLSKNNIFAANQLQCSSCSQLTTSSFLEWVFWKIKWNVHWPRYILFLREPWWKVGFCPLVLCWDLCWLMYILVASQTQ